MKTTQEYQELWARSKFDTITELVQAVRQEIAEQLEIQALSLPQKACVKRGTLRRAAGFVLLNKVPKY